MSTKCLQGEFIFKMAIIIATNEMLLETKKEVENGKIKADMEEQDVQISEDIQDFGPAGEKCS